jgi:hypothetical protein
MEYLLVGLSVAHLSVMGVQNILDSAWLPVVKGTRPSMLIPLIAGLLLYTRWVRGAAWLSRIPISFMMSIAAALTITGTLDASFLRQVRATMVPIRDLDALAMFIGTVSTVMYFFFITIPGSSANGGKGALLARAMAAGGQIGRWTMMVAFGGAFGATVMSRIGLFIGRAQFLLGEWITLIK